MEELEYGVEDGLPDSVAKEENLSFTAAKWPCVLATSGVIQYQSVSVCI